MSRRIRSIKPELIEDEKVAPLSDSAFRLFVSMITIADDHGNVRADVRWLQSQIWWSHQDQPNVLLMLVELHRAQLIEVYRVRGGTYAHLKGWDKHQRVDNAGKNRVPPPNDADAQDVDLETGSVRGDSPRNSANRRESGSQVPGSPLDRIGEEGIGLEEDAAAKTPPAKSKRVKSACVMPADWSPRQEERDNATRAGLNYAAELEAFRDHHTARGNRFADWDAAFRTWIRNALKFSGGRSPARQVPAQTEQPKLTFIVGGVEVER